MSEERREKRGEEERKREESKITKSRGGRKTSLYYMQVRLQLTEEKGLKRRARKGGQERQQQALRPREAWGELQIVESGGTCSKTRGHSKGSGGLCLILTLPEP